MSTETSYEYVVGKMDDNAYGTSITFIPFDANMSAAEAKAFFENAGYIIEYYGKFEGGVKIDLLG